MNIKQLYGNKINYTFKGETKKRRNMQQEYQVNRNIQLYLLTKIGLLTFIGSVCIKYMFHTKCTSMCKGH